MQLSIAMVLAWMLGAFVMLGLSDASRTSRKALQAEAKLNLSQLHSLMSLWQAEQNTDQFLLPGQSFDPSWMPPGFADLERFRYDYRFVEIQQDSYLAEARERVEGGRRLVFPQCNGPVDVWTINENAELVHLQNAQEGCEVSFAWRLHNDVRKTLIHVRTWLYGVPITILFVLVVFFALRRTQAEQWQNSISLLTLGSWPLVWVTLVAGLSALARKEWGWSTSILVAVGSVGLFLFHSYGRLSLAQRCAGDRRIVAGLTTLAILAYGSLMLARLP